MCSYICRIFSNRDDTAVFWPLHERSRKQVFLVDRGVSFAEKKQCLYYNIRQETMEETRALLTYLCFSLNRWC